MNRKNQSGFTLLEMLVAMVTGAIVIGAAGVFLTRTAGTIKNSVQRDAAEDQIGLLFTYVKKDMAARTDSPPPGSGLTKPNPYAPLTALTPGAFTVAVNPNTSTEETAVCQGLAIWQALAGTVNQFSLVEYNTICQASNFTFNYALMPSLAPGSGGVTCTANQVPVAVRNFWANYPVAPVPAVLSAPNVLPTIFPTWNSPPVKPDTQLVFPSGGAFWGGALCIKVIQAPSPTGWTDLVFGASVLYKTSTQSAKVTKSTLADLNVTNYGVLHRKLDLPITYDRSSGIMFLAPTPIPH